MRTQEQTLPTAFTGMAAIGAAIGTSVAGSPAVAAFVTRVALHDALALVPELDDARIAAYVAAHGAKFYTDIQEIADRAGQRVPSLSDWLDTASRHRDFRSISRVAREKVAPQADGAVALRAHLRDHADPAVRYAAERFMPALAAALLYGDLTETWVQLLPLDRRRAFLSDDTQGTQPVIEVP